MMPHGRVGEGIIPREWIDNTGANLTDLVDLTSWDGLGRTDSMVRHAGFG